MDSNIKTMKRAERGSNPCVEVIFGIITSFLTLVWRASVLGHREVGVVGGAGGDVWAAVV